jgi:RecA/RadA recombinase
MDIKQCFAARAVLTLGKDMVFRDLAQGAFRMRGIGAGQRLTIVVIPEVAQLIARQLESTGRAPLRDRAAARPLSQQQQISAWLVINAMKTESVQANQLAAQNLADIWRQNAWRTLTEHHGAFAANEADLHERVTELLGDQFYSPTLSTVNGKQLEGKSIALLFDDGSPYKSNTLFAPSSAPRLRHGRQV